MQSLTSPDVGTDAPDGLGDSTIFRTLVERSIAGIYLLERDRIVYANPRLHEIFGYPPDDSLTGVSVSSLVAEEDRDRVEESIWKWLEGGVESLHYTFHGLRQDGSVIEVEVHGSRIERDGHPMIIGTLLDITEQERARAALLENEERLRLVMRATEDAIWDWEICTGRVHWNGAGPTMFRFRPDEVGTTIEWVQQHIHPADLERVVRGLNRVLSGVGEFWSDEYRFLRGDDDFATVLDRAYVVRNGRGEPLRVIGAMMDVTARRREEEAQRFLSTASALLDSSLDYESVVAKLARLAVPTLADCCVIALGPAVGKGWRLATAHIDPQQESLLLGMEIGVVGRGGVEGAPSETVFIPEYNDAAVEARGLSARERETLTELGVRSLIRVPLVANDRTLGVITVATIDSRHQYTPVDLLLVQDLARRTAQAVDHACLYQDARRAIGARDEMLSLVSHDLRNPLHTIQMYATMLRDVSADRRADNQQWLDVIVRTVQQMRSLIDNLLDASRMEAGTFAVEPSDQDVASLVAEVHDLFKPLAEEKAVYLKSKIADGLSRIWIDSYQVLRVISNLIGNAIKFTPEAGTVTLQVSKRGKDVLFSVGDTGPGIPPDQIPHVFDRYWQARPGDRRGAGLGLTIAKGIVEAHGGRIWVESTEGKGTSFHFTIPAQPTGPGG